MSDKRLKDKAWRMSHLYKIVDKNGKKITFKPNKAQAHFIKSRWHRNIILKSRQLGFTTLEAIDMLDDALFEPNYEGVMISYDQASSLDIFDNKISFAWENFPLQHLYKVITDRANKLTFDYGDGTKSKISVKSSGRSGTLSRLHVSEFGKICKIYPDKVQEIERGSIPAVVQGGRIDIESTAEGEFGKFYDMFWEAHNRGEPKYKTEYKAHFFNWTWDEEAISKITPQEIAQFKREPEYETFKAYQDKHQLTDQEITFYFTTWISLNRDWNSLHQEYPTTPEEAFIASGSKLFSSESLAVFETEEGTREGDWIIYEDFNRWGKYAIGADVAEGIDRDSSTAVIIDFSKDVPKVVAEYANKSIDPSLFAHELARMGKRYGYALIAVECNNHGFTTISHLKDIYHNLYKGVDPRKKLESRRKRSKGIQRYGWFTSKASKPKMLYELNDAINDQQIDIPSKHIIQELRSYDQEDLSQIAFNEDQTAHWDRVIALAIAYQMKSKLNSQAGVKIHTYNKEKF